jgi:hypothetical protein
MILVLICMAYLVSDEIERWKDGLKNVKRKVEHVGDPERLPWKCS